jgi:hypothetical protein
MNWQVNFWPQFNLAVIEGLTMQAALDLIREVVPGKPELAGELKPGMKRVMFPKGKKRFVHVNRHAIVDNMKGGNFPTVMVVDHDGTRHEFHAALFGGGILKFGDEPSVEAKVYIVTTSKIVGFIDPDAERTWESQALKKREEQEATRLRAEWWAGVREWWSNGSCD